MQAEADSTARLCWYRYWSFSESIAKPAKIPSFVS